MTFDYWYVVTHFISPSLLDPVQWNEIHVKHWIDWAIKEFKLVGVNPNNFKISGKQLCELTHPEFVKLIPNDKGDIFWTHLELLRKCKFVGKTLKSSNNLFHSEF